MPQAKTSATAENKKTAPGMPDMSTMFDNSAMLEMGTSQMRTMTAMNGKLLSGWVSIQEELAEFARQRLQKDMDFQHALETCASPGDAFQLYSSFMQNAMREYWDEATKVVSLAARNGFDSYGAATRPAGKPNGKPAEPKAAE
ncbi:phasin protein [Rhodothalassium salexigens DSM 2132]|uniref:Phasin protein n=1 Tax=Rhodothalassium salexigens DSM 2132 TaxID=1188247 RepID=A0A4R2PR77_RHOSA|nr:phasin family protein [Rhodothalassium salexigens]MBB4210052.1 hypothetical protein [Rhodothalassium salexigens DSM 2132]MBK1637578.1 hypothetical protein [Rhodothalassium salexigens DSM 2132]TCP38217.1 phasin protein [Rhodothalassium salexigens DSM 2132]